VLCPPRTPPSCFVDGIGIEVTVTVDDGGASVVIRPRPEVYSSFAQWMKEGSDETAALRVLGMSDDELFEPRA
jgi:hypothetical protein